MKLDNSTENPNSGETDQPSEHKPVLEILNYKCCVLPLLYLPYFAAFTGTFSNTIVKLFMNILQDDYVKHEEGNPKLAVQYTVLLAVFNATLIFINLFLLNK